MTQKILLKSLLSLVLFLLISGFSGVPGQAQTMLGVPSYSADILDADPDSAEKLANALRQATESGVNVIVIGSDGQIITAAAPAEEETTTGEAENASSLMQAQSTVSDFRKTLRQRMQALPESTNEVAFILRATSPDGHIMTYVKVVLWSLLLFAVAAVVVHQTYGKYFARHFVLTRIKTDPQGYRDKMPFLVIRFLIGMGGTILTMLLAYVAGGLIFDPVTNKSIQITIAAIYIFFFAARTVSELWRVLLSPYLTQYRIPNYSDHDAKKFYYWAWILATYDIGAVILSMWISDFGLNYNFYAIVYASLALIGAFGGILMVLLNAQAITNAIRNGRSLAEVSWITRIVCYLLAPFLVGYIVFSWFELAFNLVLERPVSIPLVAGTYLIFISVMVVYGAINYVIEYFFARRRAVAIVNAEHDAADVKSGEVLPSSKKIRHPIATYEALARRVAAIMAFVAGTYALVVIWNPDTSMLENSIASRSLDVVVILFIGYILYHFFRIWIDSKIADESVDEFDSEMSDEMSDRSASRLATLLPLFRGGILAIVIVSIALIALMEVGINVSPLFAGAGVVGLAVGFGSQTLVRDIFSGAFFLVDDAFRKGEYVDIGGIKGTVEKISVRSFQLRHHLGALNTVPFGEIKVLTNYSRDWVIMKLPLRVTYDTNVEKVRKLIKNLGVQLLSDPVIGGNFIQPLKSQGVTEMQDSAMIIRVKFMTKPGDQWLVRKKVYEEIKDLFAREGIKFARREVTVRLADSKVDALTEQEKEAVAGAVQAGIDDEERGGA